MRIPEGILFLCSLTWVSAASPAGIQNVVVDALIPSLLTGIIPFIVYIPIDGLFAYFVANQFNRPSAISVYSWCQTLASVKAFILWNEKARRDIGSQS